jgi:hypothetical protein
VFLPRWRKEIYMIEKRARILYSAGVANRYHGDSRGRYLGNFLQRYICRFWCKFNQNLRMKKFSAKMKLRKIDPCTRTACDPSYFRRKSVSPGSYCTSSVSGIVNCVAAGKLSMIRWMKYSWGQCYDLKNVFAQKILTHEVDIMSKQALTGNLRH